MKLKNVKIGTRVMLKEDHPYRGLKTGMVGAIIEDDNDHPFIAWDDFTRGHNGGYYCKQTRIDLGLPKNSVWAVEIEYLKRIKE